MFSRRLLFASAIVAAATTGAQAQSAAEIFSYRAPSGMFSEGTTKTDMYRFMTEDAERTRQLQAGQDIVTGSTKGSAIEPETYPRPGDRLKTRARVR